MSRGRLIQLKFRRSREARAEALASVQRSTAGLWVARIGGRVRGHAEWFRSQAEAEAAVNAHYNAALLAFIKRKVAP